MEVRAESKSVRISPRKARLVAGVIKQNTLATDALVTLSLMGRRAAITIKKTLESAIANAVNNAKLKKEDLIVKRVEILDGTPLKRYSPSTRGRTHPYKKRSSHIRIILEDKYGTKS
ncbi:MAG: 50S ribosomal protein L22 [Candidatus Levybacteria bacterium]|nr:50S ribosomal protein L22 [Candidatus Levybacteria bacterium]